MAIMSRIKNRCNLDLVIGEINEWEQHKERRRNENFDGNEELQPLKILSGYFISKFDPAFNTVEGLILCFGGRVMHSD
jgi:hypothetical protein